MSIDHLRRLFADKPRRKAEHPVAIDPQLVLAVGVEPRLSRVEVVCAVDFDVQAPSRPIEVEITTASAGVTPDVLRRRFGQPVVADEFADVQFAERVCAAFGIG